MAKYDENTIDRIMDMYLKEEKSGQAIAKELGIPRSTVYFYIQRNTGYDSLDFTKRNFRFLINRSKHLESVVSVLQESRCSANDPLKLKLKELERLSGGEYNVHVLCEALKVPRGTYYNHMLRGNVGMALFHHLLSLLPEEKKTVRIIANDRYSVTRSNLHS